MRRLNFNAYHHKQKQYLIVKSICFETKRVEVYSGFTNETVFWDFDDIDICQGTGWFDKNGFEIHEGDLLAPSKDYDFKNSGHYPREIKWDSFGGCGCCYIVGGQGFDFEADEEDVSRLIIIGNRYRNPELIKK